MLRVVCALIALLVERFGVSDASSPKVIDDSSNLWRRPVLEALFGVLPGVAEVIFREGVSTVVLECRIFELFFTSEVPAL